MRRNKIIVTIDYETWQPIPEGKRIDWEEDIIIPTNLLMEKCGHLGIKLCFMIDICELIWLEQNDFSNYKKIEDQIQRIVLDGHDVQLHMHPNWMPEYGAKCIKGEFSWDWNIASCNDVPDNLDELVRRCKEKLESIVKKANPKYKCVAFRAGAYRVQPFERIYRSLVSSGIRIDSSVYANGVSSDRGYDFRKSVSNNNPYFASCFDPQLEADDEKCICEMPLAVNIYDQRLFIDNQEACNLAKNWVTMGERAFDSECNYFVLIGHTKASRNIEELCHQLVMIKNWPGVEFTTFSNDYIDIIDNSKIKLKNRRISGSIEEVKEIMDFIYATVCPEQNDSADWVGEYFYSQKALCYGYAWMVGSVLKTYGYDVKWLTVYADDMPRGRGEKLRDTHELLSLRLDGKKYILCPTSNVVYPYSITKLLRNPDLADSIIEKKEKDDRFIEREYSTYTSSFFYKRVVFYITRGFPLIIRESGRRAIVRRRVYNLMHCRIPSIIKHNNIWRPSVLG